MARITLTQHRKYRRLVRALGSPALARGILELVWEAAYNSADACVGSADDVADAVGWPIDDAPRLAALLVDTGFLDGHPDGFQVHDLWDHAPAYVKLRWERAHPGAAAPWAPDTKANVSRAENPHVPGKGCTQGSDQEVEQRREAAPPAPPVEKRTAAARSVKPVLMRLAHEIDPADLGNEADRKEALKVLAVRYRIDYRADPDPAVITAALDAIDHVKRAPLWVRDLPRAARRRVC